MLWLFFAQAGYTPRPVADDGIQHMNQAGTVAPKFVFDRSARGDSSHECPKCGKSSDGKSNCCSEGGTWQGQCTLTLADGGQHTWSDGYDACDSDIVLHSVAPGKVAANCADWCSHWTVLAPECAGCESNKPKKGGLSILDFLHDKQAKGVPPEDAASVVESEPPQNPSVAYQIATPDRRGGGDTTVMKAPKRKCQSQWDGDCDRSDLHEPLQRPCQSLWDGDCDRSALRELRLPNQGPSREEWASKEAKASQEKVQQTEKQAQQQEKQDRATLLESSGLDELVPVAVPG